MKAQHVLGQIGCCRHCTLFALVVAIHPVELPVSHHLMPQAKEMPPNPRRSWYSTTISDHSHKADQTGSNKNR